MLKLTTYYHTEEIPDNIPGDNFFYSKEMFGYYESTQEYYPVLIVAFDDQTVIGKLLITWHKTTHWFPFSLINHCFAYGTGEYFCSDNLAEYAFSEILDYIEQTILKQCNFILFRDLPDSMFGYKVFRSKRYFPVRWMRTLSIINKNLPLDICFNHSRRRQIKKALKSGATVHRATEQKDLDDFSLLLRRNYPYKVRKHFPCIQFLQHTDRVKFYSKNISVYLVKYEDILIGGCVVVYSENKAYIPFCGGIRRLYKHQYPGVLALWAALREVYQRDCESLEYMDAGLPFRHNGFREFVGRFGAQNESSRRWFHIRHGWLNKLLTNLYL